MGINFPATPALNQLYPDPATAGIPQYKWDGTAWVAVSTPEALTYVKRTGDTMTGLLTLSGDPTADLHAVPKRWAAPLDAMAYSGMQLNGLMTVNLTALTTYAVGRNIDNWAMWSVGTQVANTSVVAVTLPGFTTCLQSWCSTANPSPAAAHVLFFDQQIEGFRVSRLAWGTANAQPITIGFWVHTNKPPGLFSGSVRNNGSRSYVFTYTINAANTWEYKVVTIPGDTTGTWAKDNTVGLDLAFAIMAGSGYQTTPGAWAAGNFIGATGTTNCVTTTADLFHLTGVVVLPGVYAPTATQSPLIMRPTDQEVLMCHRYWQKTGMGFNGIWSSAVGCRFRIKFPEMRASPTLALTSSSVNAEIWGLTGVSTTTANFVGHSSTLNSADFSIGGFSSSATYGDWAILTGDYITIDARF